jgi:hypothetical protein
MKTIICVSVAAMLAFGCGDDDGNDVGDAGGDSSADTFPSRGKGGRPQLCQHSRNHPISHTFELGDVRNFVNFPQPPNPTWIYTATQGVGQGTRLVRFLSI